MGESLSYWLLFSLWCVSLMLMWVYFCRREAIGFTLQFKKNIFIVHSDPLLSHIWGAVSRVWHKHVNQIVHESCDDRANFDFSLNWSILSKEVKIGVHSVCATYIARFGYWIYSLWSNEVSSYWALFMLYHFRVNWPPNFSNLNHTPEPVWLSGMLNA